MKDNSSCIKQKNKKTIKIDQGWQDLLWLILGIKLGNTPGGGGGAPITKTRGSSYEIYRGTKTSFKPLKRTTSTRRTSIMGVVPPGKTLLPMTLNNENKELKQERARKITPKQRKTLEVFTPYQGLTRSFGPNKRNDKAIRRWDSLPCRHKWKI